MPVPGALPAPWRRRCSLALALPSDCKGAGRAVDSSALASSLRSMPASQMLMLAALAGRPPCSLAGRAGPGGPAPRQAQTVPRTVCVRARPQRRQQGAGRAPGTGPHHRSTRGRWCATALLTATIAVCVTGSRRRHWQQPPPRRAPACGAPRWCQVPSTAACIFSSHANSGDC